MHMIDMSNDRANMAYVGETPWHGLGAQLNPGDSIEQWRKAAGLEYTVEAAPVYYQPSIDLGDGQIEPTSEPMMYKGRRVLYRSDTSKPLSVVSDGYHVVQPGEVLDFVAQCVQSAGFTMETAGVIDEGRKVWALAKVHDGAPVIGQDIVRPYLLAATSYDTSMSTTFKFTMVRVVCNNTLTASAGGNSRIGSGQSEQDKTDGAVVQCVRIEHSSKPNFQLIRQQLGIVLDAWDRFIVDARLLADTKVDDKFTTEFLKALLRKDRSAEATAAAAETRAFKHLMALVTGEAPSRSTPESSGTAWGLLNAVTWYVDHERGSDAKRLNSAWFGSGEGLKNKARDMLLEVVS